jgi:hypothetical protein
MRSIIATAAVAAVATSAGPAAAKTTHHYKSTIHNNAVATANGYPNIGGTAVLAGTWVTDLFGTGSVVDHVTITGRPSSTTFTFRGTETCFAAKGSLSDRFSGTATVNPDGTQTITIKGRYVGGTGAYRGAKGSFTFNGATASGSSIVNGHSSGTISY